MSQFVVDKCAVIAGYLKESADCRDIQSLMAEIRKAAGKFADVAAVELCPEARLLESQSPEAFFGEFSGQAAFQSGILSIAKEVRLNGRAAYRSGETWTESETLCFSQIGGRSAAGFPIVYQNELIAVLVVILKEEQFTKEVLAFFETFAEILALQLSRFVMEGAFSVISHELKTPVNIMLSSMELLKIKLSSHNEMLYQEQYSRLFTYTEKNAHKLLHLLRDLLDCTRLENGALTLSAAACQIVPFVRHIVESTESYAHTHKIKLSFDTGMAEETVLFCDEEKVDRILLNLISNSIKHTKEGGEIRVGLSQTTDFVRLTVADNGHGIPPEMLPYLFERFKVYEKGFVKSSAGTGIGLSIVKGLAELHGGSVSVESKLEEGTVFTVTLSRNLCGACSNERNVPA